MGKPSSGKGEEGDSRTSRTTCGSRCKASWNRLILPETNATKTKASTFFTWISHSYLVMRSTTAQLDSYAYVRHALSPNWQNRSHTWRGGRTSLAYSVATHSVWQIFIFTEFYPLKEAPEKKIIMCNEMMLLWLQIEMFLPWINWGKRVRPRRKRVRRSRVSEAWNLGDQRGKYDSLWDQYINHWEINIW